MLSLMTATWMSAIRTFNYGPGVIGAALTMVAIAGFFLTLSIEGGDASWQKHAFPFVAAAIGAIGIILAMKLNTVFEETPALRVAGLYLGRISYSIYLFHIFAVAGTWAIAKRMFDVQPPLIYAIGAAIAMLAGLVFGLLCHHYIERPLLAAGTTRSRAVRAT